MASLKKKATQLIRMQNSSHLKTKMLPPFGAEGPSADEHAGFQLQQNHMLKCDTMLQSITCL